MISLREAASVVRHSNRHLFEVRFPSIFRLEHAAETGEEAGKDVPQGLNRLRKKVEQRAKTVPSAAKAGHNYNHLRTA